MQQHYPHTSEDVTSHLAEADNLEEATHQDLITVL